MTKKKTNNTRDIQNKNGRKTTQTKTNPSTRPKTRTPKQTTVRKKRKKHKGLHRKKATKRQKQLITLAGLIVIIFVVIFIGKKTVGFVSNIWPNVVSIKTSLLGGNVDRSNVNTDEQFDVGDEKQTKLEDRHNVFIDVGGGGNEIGYITDDIKEKDLNLELAKKVAKELSKYDDINVILSRQEDIYMSADERKSLAQSQEAEVFVSIHMAGESTGKAEGIETIYHAGAQNGSYDFAGVMQTSMLAFVKSESRGVSSYDMSILRDNTMPSIYIQCGFLSNTNDKKNLKNKEYQDNLAKGIAQGILSYIDAKK